MKHSFILIRAQILVLIVAGAGSLLHAQQSGQPQVEAAPDSPEYRLTTTVRRVLVDVTITDSHGVAVHGLRPDDFVLEEDGKPQRVLTFDTYNFDKGMDYAPPSLAVNPANTFVNLPADPERGPLYVLLYDLVNIAPENQVFARKQLVKFMQNKPAGARVAILVSSDGVHVVQGFTSNQHDLLAAIDPKGTGPHVPEIFLMGVNFGEGDKLAASARLNSIARYLAPMPGKKILIWFASEFPLSLFPSQDETKEYREEAKKTLDLLAENRIAVYPVDVSGVVIAESYGAPGNSGEMPGGSGLSSDLRGGGLQKVDPAAPKPVDHSKGLGYSQTNSSYLTQDAIAKTTGGKAVYSSNDLVNSLNEVVENGGNYYTLAYSPSDKNFDGRLRHIEVKMKEGKFHLEYQRAYYGASAEAVGQPVNDALSSSMKHGAPELHALVFQMRIASSGSPAKGSKEQMVSVQKAQGGKESKALKPVLLQAYTLDYAVMARALRADGDTDPQFDLAAAAYDADGQTLNSIVNRTMKLGGAAGGDAPAREVYRVEQEIDVPLGAKFLRVAVRDVQTGKLGAMEIPLPLAAAK